MKQHKLLFAGIIGVFISLVYLGLLYQSGKILNEIISIDNSDWNVSANYFVSPISFALGIICLIGALICCAIDIIIAYKSRK